jgi:hypothetical protein
MLRSSALNGMREDIPRHDDHSKSSLVPIRTKNFDAGLRGTASVKVGISGAWVANPQDNDMRPQTRGAFWAIWAVVAVGLGFAAIYAVGGCLLQTIC